MVRKIVKISEENATDAGLCISACHEGALVLENGKAKLVSDVYCDGLGDCLPNARQVPSRLSSGRRQLLMRKQ